MYYYNLLFAQNYNLWLNIITEITKAAADEPLAIIPTSLSLKLRPKIKLVNRPNTGNNNMRGTKSNTIIFYPFNVLASSTSIDAFE